MSKQTDKAEADAKAAKGSEGKQAVTGSQYLDTTSEPGPSAATLEEALAQQDAANREQSDAAAAESGAAYTEAQAEANAAIEEAGAAQEARDDEVYGRVPGAEDRRPGIGETATPAQDKQVKESVQATADES